MELRIPEPFLQKHLEAFQVALSEKRKPDDDYIVESIYRRRVLEAAIDVGWLEECDISEQSASEVYQLGGEVQDKLNEVLSIPKN